MEPDGQRKVVAVNGVFNLEANVAMRIIHRYRKKKIDCLKFVLCPLLVPHF